MIKIDDKKYRLKHKICLNLTINLPEQNRKYKKVTVKTCIKSTTPTIDFDCIFLYLSLKNVFITLELNRYFRIAIVVIEDNPNTKIRVCNLLG